MILCILSQVYSQTLKLIWPEASCLSLYLADNDILAEVDGWLFERAIGFDKFASVWSSLLLRGGLSGIMDFDLCF